MCNHCENDHNSCHSSCCDHNHNEGSNNSLTKKLIVVFTIFVFVVIFKPENLISQTFHLNPAVIKFSIYFILYLIIAKDIILNAFKNLFNKKFLDENFLMTIATFGAFAIGKYPEALMVMLLYQTGELFTDFALDKSKKSVLSLMDLKPEYANLVNEVEIKKVHPETIKVNDIILVKPGEKIPLDGVVIEGTTSVDTSNLTGEVLPKVLKTGDSAASGCINLNGAIKIKVTKEFHDSTVAKIIEMVQHASDRKTRTEKFITRFARIYTPCVVLMAMLLLIVPYVFGGEFFVWFKRALTFLVISCPCALVISVPLGFFASIGAASKYGILIKGSNYIEALSRAKIMVFDKTGTLTSGVFKVLEVHPVDNISKDEFIKYAAAAEYLSTHPVARSIQSAYSGCIDPSVIKNYKEISGCGITAEIEKHNVVIGNSAIMEKFNISYPQNIKGKAVVYMAIDDKFAGFLTIGDTAKTDVKPALEKLKNYAGIEKIVVLTGDSSLFGLENPEIQNLIDEAHCSLLPGKKLERVEKLMETKKSDASLIFAGDGINDAPVLSRADVGIAMGKIGSDIAIEAADVVIMDDNPSKILAAINIAKKTISVVKQNIVFILFIKILFLVLGACGAVTMWGAVFADVGVCILAIINSMRILYFKI